MADRRHRPTKPTWTTSATIARSTRLEIVLLDLSLTCDDDDIIRLFGPVFDGTCEYGRQCVLLGREPS